MTPHGSRDGVGNTISGLLHAMNRPAVGGRDASPARGGLSAQAEEELIANADQYLRDGIGLYRWWRDNDESDGFRQRFELQRTFNRATSSYGFFGDLHVRSSLLPLMGNVQEMMYDTPRVPPRLSRDMT